MGERLTGLGPPLAFQKKFETGMDSLGVTLITPPRSRAPTWSPERALMRSVRAGDSCSKMQNSTHSFFEKFRKNKSAADSHSIRAEKCPKIGVPRRYVPKAAIPVSLPVSLCLSDNEMWRALVLHTQRSGPRDRHEERCCGSRLQPIRGQLLLGHLTVSTTQVSLLDPSTACEPPLMTLELPAVLLPMFLTDLPCALVPTLAGCLELTCVLSKRAQDHWQLEIRAVTGGVDGPLRRNAYITLKMVGGFNAVARPSILHPFIPLVRCARASCSRA